MDDEDEDEPLSKQQRKTRDFQDKKTYIQERLRMLEGEQEETGDETRTAKDEREMLEQNWEDTIANHHSDTDGSMESDAVLNTARLDGAAKRKQEGGAPSKKGKTKRRTQGGGTEEQSTPISLLVQTPVDTNYNRRDSYRLATFHEIRAIQHPRVDLRWAGQYYDESNLKPGYLVVSYNHQFDETYVRYHASKKHGTKDHMCTL